MANNGLIAKKAKKKQKTNYVFFFIVNTKFLSAYEQRRLLFIDPER